MKKEYKNFQINLGRDRTAIVSLSYPKWFRFFIKFLRLDIFSGHFFNRKVFNLNLNYKNDGTYREPLELKDIIGVYK